MQLVKYENGQLTIAQEAMQKIAQVNAMKKEAEKLEKQIKSEMLDAPNFQSVYVCSGVLDKQITFTDYEF